MPHQLLAVIGCRTFGGSWQKQVGDSTHVSLDLSLVLSLPLDFLWEIWRTI